jgi:Ligand-gated ion channel
MLDLFARHRRNISVSGRRRICMFRPTQSFMFWIGGVLLLLTIFETTRTTKSSWVALAQQKPFVTIPRFQKDYIPPNFNTSIFRTNVCQRQELLYEGKTELGEALEGLNISVAITNYPQPNENYFFTLSSTGGIKEEDPGLFVVILDEIARRGKFEWRNTYSAIDPIDSMVDGNKTWSDLLLWELDHFDISADYWGRSTERMARGVSFPKGWYDGSVVLVQSVAPYKSKDVSLWSFLLPFDRYVWLAIVGAIVFTGLMYLVLERLNTESDERELEARPWVSIFIASLTFTGHFEFRPNTNPARLMSFSWTFWALIMASAYTANLASSLVSRKNEVVVVATLEEALKRNTPICIQRYTIMDDIVSRKYPDMNVVRKETEKEIFDGLRLPWYGGPEQGCGAALTNLGTFENYRNNKETNWDCSLTTERRVIQSLPAGFATSVDTGNLCTSLISYVLNFHLSEMIQDTFIEMSWNEHISKISEISCPEYVNINNDADDNYRLSLKDMAGIFIVHGFLMLTALSIAMIDRWRKKKTE